MLVVPSHEASAKGQERAEFSHHPLLGKSENTGMIVFSMVRAQMFRFSWCSMPTRIAPKVVSWGQVILCYRLSQVLSWGQVILCYRLSQVVMGPGDPLL
jgi:hypothetical protein